METTIHTSQSKIKAIAAILVALSCCVLLISVISHVTFDVMATTLFDFAIHHYFVMIFVSLIVLAVSIKVYTALDEKIDRNYRESHSFELSKDRRKRLKLSNLFKGSRGRTIAGASRFVKIEEVMKLKFGSADVLLDEEAKSQRQRDLQKASVLGEAYTQKIIILFRDEESKKHLITSIWQSTSDHIILRAGIILPVRSIYKIEF